MQKLITLLGLYLCLCLSLQTALAETATIAVASNFKAAMAELITAFEASHPHQLKQSNAASGIIFNWVRQGAPYQAFLAADSRYPHELEQLGIGIAGTRFTYAEGQLVMAMTNTNTNTAPVNASEEELAFIDIIQTSINSNHKIAIANPLLAPYGIAAQQTLQQLNLWQAAEPQLVKGSNIGQTFQFLHSNNVALAFIAGSQTLSVNQTSNHTLIHYWPIPHAWHQPIRQQAILLQSGLNNEAAIQFLAFLQSDQAKTIIRRNGYTAP